MVLVKASEVTGAYAGIVIKRWQASSSRTIDSSGSGGQP